MVIFRRPRSSGRFERGLIFVGLERFGLQATTPMTDTALASVLGISPEIIERTPPEILTLVAKLEARIRELEARLATNSSNSSKPPSSDPPWAKPRGKKSASGKPHGAQPGHSGNARPILPLEQVDAVVVLAPEACTSCGTSFAGDDPNAEVPRRHQVHELPEITTTVTEYQLHRRRCASCGTTTEAALPPEVPRGAFGPRLQAEVAFLTGRFRLSRRELQAYASQAWGVEISLGSVCAIERSVSQALAQPYDEAWDAVRAADVRHLDETGWREKNRRSWLWAATSARATAFRIAATRGRNVVTECFGDALERGYFVTDRYAAYKVIAMERRGVCHAHLNRDFLKIEQRGGYAGYVVGTAALGLHKEMFALVAEHKSGTSDSTAFSGRMEQIKARMRAVLDIGVKVSDAKVQGMCVEILKHWSALWRFADVAGLEATNNAAERVIRKGVLWRKGSFGSQSAAGSRFAERILTVAETCRQNGRTRLAYLSSVVRADLCGEVAPRLIPASG